jgi:hypothetical protein
MSRDLLLLSLGLTYASSATAQTAFDYHSRVGVALTDTAGFHCLAIPASDLTPGTEVTLADPGDSAAVVRAAITVPVRGMCPGEVPDPNDHLYGLRVASPPAPQPGSVWFALLLTQGTLHASRAGIHGDLDHDGTEEHLRVCTSAEGLHLTIWTGAPLVGRRRWHRYFYLGYDVEPSCGAGDYDGT